jgi:hypothetical protein
LIAGRYLQARRYAKILSQLIHQLLTRRRGLMIDVERYVATRTTTPLQTSTGPVDVADSLPNVAPVTFAVADRNNAEPVLNVMIPGMALWAMSGGPNTALNLTLRLAREGVPVRYISTDVAGEDDHELLWNHLRNVTGIADRYPHVQFVDGHDRGVETPIENNDVFFGTAWWTVQMVKHVLGRMGPKRFLYFIQDFEPALYPWSSTYALALETYGLDFRGIINESLLAEHLVASGAGRFADSNFLSTCTIFEPAVNRAQFYPAQSERTGERKRLLFYARPNAAPRNLYELGLLALKRAAEQGVFPPDEWELRFMGEQIPSVRLTPDVIIEPLPWLDFPGYARLLRESHVGLAPMLSPHTGYPVLEMAACGVAAVTTMFGTKTAERLTAISPNIVPASATVEGMTEGLLSAVETASSQPEFLGDLRLPETWDEVFAPHLPMVLEMIDDCRRS